MTDLDVSGSGSGSKHPDDGRGYKQPEESLRALFADPSAELTEVLDRAGEDEHQVQPDGSRWDPRYTYRHHLSLSPQPERRAEDEAMEEPLKTPLKLPRPKPLLPEAQASPASATASTAPPLGGEAAAGKLVSLFATPPKKARIQITPPEWYKEFMEKKRPSSEPAPTPPAQAHRGPQLRESRAGGRSQPPRAHSRRSLPPQHLQRLRRFELEEEAEALATPAAASERRATTGASVASPARAAAAVAADTGESPSKRPRRSCGPPVAFWLPSAREEEASRDSSAKPAVGEGAVKAKPKDAPKAARPAQPTRPARAARAVGSSGLPRRYWKGTQRTSYGFRVQKMEQEEAEEVGHLQRRGTAAARKEEQVEEEQEKEEKQPTSRAHLRPKRLHMKPIEFWNCEMVDYKRERGSDTVSVAGVLQPTIEVVAWRPKSASRTPSTKASPCREPNTLERRLQVLPAASESSTHRRSTFKLMLGRSQTGILHVLRGAVCIDWDQESGEEAIQLMKGDTISLQPSTSYVVANKRPYAACIGWAKVPL